MLSSLLPILSKAYQEAEPFPHIVIDDLLDQETLKEVSDSFPDPKDKAWWSYNNVLEKKLALDDPGKMNLFTRCLIHELMEKRFCKFLEGLTGINGLIVDQTLNGGGLHQIVRDGKLDIHADYNFHPVTRLDRRLNVLLYLNPNWQPEWKGNLELWDAEMSRCVKSIEPKFNRLVIFSTTDTAFHGHPDALECPINVSRKSMALYYYTNGRPQCEQSKPHSTVFRRRPHDPIDQETEELRIQRATRRLT